MDRSKEQLGTSDQVIIRGRRLLLEAAHAYSEGKVTRGLDCEVPYDQIEAKSFVLPPGVDWREPEGVVLSR